MNYGSNIGHMSSVKLGDLISQYDGRSDFLEWVNKLELVAELQNLDKLESVLPLFLTEGAFAVYKGLSADIKKNYVEVKKELKKAFCKNQFNAYEELISRKLKDDEAVDVYLADLKKQCELILDCVPEKLIICAFVNGLPVNAKGQIKSLSALEEMNLNDIVSMARSIVKDDQCMFGAISERRLTGRGGTSSWRNRFQEMPQKSNNDVALAEERRQKTSLLPKSCYDCGEAGHLARDCPRNQRFCYVCGDENHFAGRCPKRILKPTKN